MKKLIRKLDCPIMLWKNGMGSTAQILIDPEDSEFTMGSFCWRLSSAKVSAPSDFSIFKGYHRVLMVLEGQGLKLNDLLLKPFQVHSFSGEESIHCQPVQNEPVLDLGLIYRPGELRVEMKPIFLSGEITLALSPGVHLFHCANGVLEIDDSQLSVGDTLKVADLASVSLKPAATGKVTCVHLHISKLRPDES